ncbi:MAG: virulence factor [Chloroflexota bacterium]|nr:MAG: virulence factor [Chloroflexota bacterium]
MAEYQILYWHDIPLQVRVGSRPSRVRLELAPRFQDTVDRVAMAAGLTDTDEYLDGFRWGETQEREGSDEEVAAALVSELETAYPQLDWQRSVRAIRAEEADNESE